MVKVKEKYCKTKCIPTGILLNVNPMKQSLCWPIAVPEGSRRVRVPESTPGPWCSQRIMSVKNSYNTIGNQTHDLLACSAVLQTNSPP